MFVRVLRTSRNSFPTPGPTRAVRCVNMSKSTVDQFRQCKGTANKKQKPPTQGVRVGGTD